MQGSNPLLVRIGEIIGPAVEAMGFELVRLRFTGGDQRTLQVMAERPTGEMSVDDCAELSRTISVLLDVEDPIAGEYILEVSSPGIDRPLTRRADFERFAGHVAKLEVIAPIDGQRRFRGEIGGVSEGIVQILSNDGNVVDVPFDNIGDAQLIITDKLIRESLGTNPDAKTQH